VADCAAHPIGLPHGLYGSGEHQFRVVADERRAEVRAGLDTQAIGHLITDGGILGLIGILFVGWSSDRHGDRLRDAFACTINSLLPSDAAALYTLTSQAINDSGQNLVDGYIDASQENVV
jgi:hypothetical protein